ncbi:MAG: cyclic nucleotide-binding domain-containing protein [Proteobacteria bacterium]|nr:cyclic nucleotide-binding domain-containing protein [Pseudomonadota bacterium]MBU1586204.1 cyclic nucleotide-binding domain-containing protein [Pseudomonadota bacterium]MBU2454001.1 cyclic nucleotide-binding domain-containing protein [Pseudomonadota bacterium]MBU2628477.1 cyclic nucleotide-binding domain-containing protein [Pseudomonadota bacterium]
MVEKDVLKKIVFLKDLPGSVLEKVGAIAQLETFDEESILFRQEQEQKLLYMLVSGKVFLNSRSGSGKSLTLDEVSYGRTFGVSALMGEAVSTFTAICAQTSSIITVSGDQMRELFESDFEIGHTLMQKVVELFKSRMDRHTRQFLNSLATHPEIKQV